VVRASLASKTLFDTFDEKPLVVAPAVRSAVPLHNRSIRLDDVSFGYRPMQPVLRRVSFEVPFGQTVALLGNNGSGKTTLIHLLTRFYDPTKGDIFIDG